MTAHYEKLTNLILLRNNLYHIEFELNRTHTSFARIGRESHQALYRAMVEALRGSANLSITGRSNNKNRETIYRFGSQPFYKISKTKLKNCKHAWRYSKPVVCPEPKYQDSNQTSDHAYQAKDYLKSFYDLLAMIQTECFMLRYIHSRPIHVSNEEMELLEWLHQEIRNRYEHFIPAFVGASIYDLKASSLLCLEIVKTLLYESGNVDDIPRGIKTRLEKFIRKVRKLKTADATKHI